MLRTGFGIFSDILPGSVADLVGINPPYVKTFQGGLLGRVGRHGDCARSAQQRSRCHRCGESEFQLPGFQQGQLSCASPLANPATCLPPVAITAVPDGKLHAPYFMEWSLGIEHQFGTQAACRRSTSALAP